jgi:hypothetical protein
MNMKDEPNKDNTITEAYRERLRFFNEKLTGLMMAVDGVLLGGPTDDSQELIETKLGEFCYTMELSLYSGDLSVPNVALSTAKQAVEASTRLSQQPLALLRQMEKALNAKPPESEGVN